MPEFNFSYKDCIREIDMLTSKYPFVSTGSIGNSVLGKSIPYIRLGVGPIEVFFSGSYHASEWITSPVLLKFAYNFCEAYSQSTCLHINYNIDQLINILRLSMLNSSNPAGIDIHSISTEHKNILMPIIKNIFNTTSIYIVPLVNPDGVNLSTNSMNLSIPSEFEAYNNAMYIAKSFPEISFPQEWKANILGTDLNLQFPANWNEAKRIKYSLGYTKPAPKNFVGYGPLTAPESLAIYNFTLAHDFKLILAYHTQGETIYWQYQNYLPQNSYYIGEQFSKVSNYVLESTPYDSSFAGYKDWFIEYYNRPGYTIECGLGTSPLPITQFNDIYNKNFGIFVLATILS